jgi:hypothetical protein
VDLRINSPNLCSDTVENSPHRFATALRPQRWRGTVEAINFLKTVRVIFGLLSQPYIRSGTKFAVTVRLIEMLTLSWDSSGVAGTGRHNNTAPMPIYHDGNTYGGFGDQRRHPRCASRWRRSSTFINLGATSDNRIESSKLNSQPGPFG